MEKFPTKRTPKPEQVIDRSPTSQAKDPPDGRYIGGEFFRNKDIETFEKFDSRFDNLAPDNRPMFKKEGDRVRFPSAEGKNVEWQVARAEKMHYLLERRSEDNLYDFAFCSDQELREQGEN